MANERESLEIMCAWHSWSKSKPKPFDYEEHVQHWLESRRWEERYILEKVSESVESPIEAIAYLTLLANAPTGMGIWPQKQIGSYRVDFYVEYKGYKIIIECDGHDFHEKTKEQASRDKKRDRYFTQRGYIVLRYTGSDIKRNPYQILDEIEIATDPELQELYRRI